MKKLFLIPLLFILLSGCMKTHNGFVVLDKKFKIDGGNTITLPMTRVGPLPAENELYKIVSAGHLSSMTRGEPEKSFITWSFMFKSKSSEPIESVTVEYVSTEGDLFPMVEDKDPELKDDHWGGKSKRYAMTESESPWLYSNSDSVFLFKFTIVGADKSVSVLYQPSLTTKEAKAFNLKVIQ